MAEILYYPAMFAPEGCYQVGSREDCESAFGYRPCGQGWQAKRGRLLQIKEADKLGVELVLEERLRHPFGHEVDLTQFEVDATE